MSRGGHNWKGGGTVDGTRSLDVRKLARAGYLGDAKMGAWQWSYPDGSVASVLINGGRDTITRDYRFKSSQEDVQPVKPIFNTCALLDWVKGLISLVVGGVFSKCVVPREEHLFR